MNWIWSSVYLMYILHETFPKIVYGTWILINSLIFKDKLQEMSSSNIWQNIRTKIKYTFWNLIVSTQKSQLIYCKSDIWTLISNHWNHWIDKPFKEYWIFGLARIQLMFYFGLCSSSFTLGLQTLNMFHRPPNKLKYWKWMPKTNFSVRGPHEVH